MACSAGVASAGGRVSAGVFPRPPRSAIGVGSAKSRGGAGGTVTITNTAGRGSCCPVAGRGARSFLAFPLAGAVRGRAGNTLGATSAALAVGAPAYSCTNRAKSVDFAPALTGATAGGSAVREAVAGMQVTALISAGGAPTAGPANSICYRDGRWRNLADALRIARILPFRLNLLVVLIGRDSIV
jgi:hypothetical protein